ncbi:MAG: alpha/beta fold hydrolase [Pseudomonadota bacterium]
MAMLNRNGVAISYDVHGSGPALLLTHGFSATARMWDPQIEALSARHTLILWDLRGHGLSAAPEAPEAYLEREATADMAALLDAVGAETAIIGGLSLGGYLSLAFHCDYSERTRALLIIDTGPGYKRDDGRAAWNRQANAMADSIERDGMAALSGGSAERSAAVHRDLNGVVRAGRSLLTQHSPRVIESLPAIEVPSLVVVGAEDEPFLAATDYMAAKIAGAEKVVVAEAGHAVNLDQPQIFNAALIDFLDRHGL